MDDEEELVFKRFSADKQDQVRGLVNYATLMGLTGKDLVSIGGKLDRLRRAQKTKANMEVVKSFDLLPIGDRISDRRFKLKTATGDAYNFELEHSQIWKVTSLNTKKILKHEADVWEKCLPRRGDYDSRKKWAMLLDIANGKFKLDF